MRPGRAGFGPEHTDLPLDASDLRLGRRLLMAEIDQLSPWWAPARHRDSRPFLAARGASPRHPGVVRRQGFVEVETGILQVSPGNETHLHAPRTELRDRAGRARRAICGPRRNSPARSCWRRAKQKIFEFARVFRDRERGDLHLPEFTMLEWYRASEPYDAVMADSVVVIAHAAQATGIGRFSFRGRTPIRLPSRSG